MKSWTDASTSLDLWVAEGNEAVSGEPLAVLCADRGALQSHLLELAFGGAHRVRRVGRAWPWNLRRAIRRQGQDCALALVRQSGPDTRFARRAGGFAIPTWVVGEANIPLPDEVARHSSVRSDLQRIRRNGLGYEVTRDLSRLREFHAQMYRPHVRRAHGPSAHLVAYDQMEAKFRKCELLVVEWQGERIAGIVIRYKGPTPRLWSVGVLHGERKYVDAGAIAALFHFAFQHLAERGHRVVNLGLSRPFLDDGVFRYKKKLGHRIVAASKDWHRLSVLACTPGARSFLREHPFVFWRGGAPRAAVFLDSDGELGPGALERLRASHAVPGIATLELHRLDDAGPVPITEATGEDPLGG